jgi:hypothetical protein
VHAAENLAAEYARAVQAAGFDPDACYRVRDLAFQKDDLRFYLTEGHLIFSRPVEGRRLGAMFVANVQGGDAEVLLFPPHRSERLSLAAFAKTPNLNEHFTSGLLIFTDGTGEELLKQIRSGTPRPAPEIGTTLASMYSDTLRNLSRSYEIRIVQDRFSGAGPANGFFYAALTGKTVGNFDLLYDPAQRDSITVGQVVFRDEKTYFDTWTSFESREFRTGRKQRPPGSVKVSAVRIEATIQPADLTMQALTTLSLEATGEGDSVVAFQLSRRMKVLAAKVDDVPVEVFTRDSLRANLNRGENELFLIVLPNPLTKGAKHKLEIAHTGNVVTQSGNGVYFVGARTSWYPHRDAEFAPYELIFKHPKTLNLVATGELAGEVVEGEWRIARHRTSSPIRFAGFNLGDYKSVETTKAGVRIEVHANARVEAALQPRSRDVLVVPPSPFPSRSSQPRRPAEIMTLPAPPAPSASGRLLDLSSEIGSAVELMVKYFGPPPLKTLTVSPIPGVFGQGFPGLVYLSTLAYLNPADRPPGWQSESSRTFFSELIHAHEAAHQWWGNLVTASSYQDEWLMEALANYTAMLVLEKRKGRKALDAVLDEYRRNLLAKPQDKTIESYGPIIWGIRLISSQSPTAWRTITYEKGSWIIHMVRMRLGDDAFLRLLGELTKRKRLQPLSTEEFRTIAAGFLPPKSEDPKLENFFEQWVYSTGIPTLKMKYSVQGKAPKLKLRGTVEQSEAPDDFSTLVPVELQFPGRRVVTHWVRTGPDETPFSIDLRIAPVKVTLDPGNAVLARK